jgi:AAHS family 4-hydroxybenzoate transporter-like MFS transporter
LPTVLNDLGASVSLAVAIGAMFQVGGVVGAFALGTVIDRFTFRALALIYLLAAVAVTAIGISQHSIVLATVAIFCAGFCIIGGQTASNALAATSYPTPMRSTGVGWALGIGRIGSIVGPAIGGVMLARHLPPDRLFLAAAVPAVCGALAAIGLVRVSRGASTVRS